MSEWTAGYVAEIDYTFGYYTELNPLRTRLAFLSAGLTPPAVGTACELGFGQGLSTNLHAAASGIAWSGTDFNPSQAAFASEVAQASGADAQLFDQSFIDFAARGDLPDYDFIGLHGIWSWISDDNRRVIVDFVRRKLKVGGVLYISYNTLPGWAPFAPMRHLIKRHAEVIGIEGQGIVKRIDGALSFATRLLATNPAFARAVPQAAERLKMLSTQNRHYLAHEYFCRDWHPMHVATTAEWLEPAKLSFACSAHYLDAIDGVNLTNEQQAFLKEIPDPMFRESVRDFMTNQQFRRDYWVKGPRRLAQLDQVELFRAQTVVLATPRADIELKVTGALGEVRMAEDIYGPILDALADHKPRTIQQIEQALQGRNIAFGQLWQAVLLLVGVGHVYLTQPAATVAKARANCAKVNAWLINRARTSGDITFLASPLVGGGVPVGRFQQLFLAAIAQGRKQPQEWAQHVWQVLDMQQQKIIKDGQPLPTADDNLAELNALAAAFAEKQLPSLKSLMVA